MKNEDDNLLKFYAICVVIGICVGFCIIYFLEHC